MDELKPIRLLFIGATGHIGGAAFDSIFKAHPELNITALVRSESNAKHISERYTGVKTYVGGVEDPALAESLAKEASIVIYCAPDVLYGAGIKALLSGLASQNKHTYYIHTSGASLIWDDSEPKGEPVSRVWDDVADIEEILALPDSRRHGTTDHIVTKGNTTLLRTAIISSVTVMGSGPSATHPVPITFPDLFHVIKELNAGYTINKGENYTSLVGVKQLAQLYLKLVNNAVAQLSGAAMESTKPEVPAWGREAFYFGASTIIQIKEFMRDRLIPALKRCDVPYVQSGECKQTPYETVRELIKQRLGGVPGAERWSTHIVDLYSTNMRVKGTRAEKALGVRWEADDLGMDEAVQVYLERNQSWAADRFTDTMDK